MEKPKQPDDLTLITQAQAGDSASMEALIIRHKALVCRVCRRFYLTGGDNDDLIQEGTIGFIKAVLDYTPEKNRSFFNYATICVTNKVKDALRATMRDKHSALNNSISITTEKNEEYIVDSVATASDPLTNYIDDEAREDFYRIAEEILSPQQLVVLKLYLEGYTYKEIADRLRVTQKAVDNALTIAKDKLRKAQDKF